MLTCRSRKILVRKRQEEGSCWDRASSKCGGGEDYAADHFRGDLGCPRAFAQQHDSDLNISLGEEWLGNDFLRLPNNPDWTKKGDLGQ